MKKKLNSCLIIFTVFALSSCVNNTNPQQLSPQKITETDQNDVDVVKDVSIENSPSKVMSPPMPENLDFAGELVNTKDWDVRERLDYELTVNMYYHSKMQFYLKRAHRWFPVIEPILKEQGLPDDFKYLAVIESALSQAVSPSGAKGFWQFMPATGKEYGMLINGQIDERYHVVKSTYAACEYLKKAHKKFGNWISAAASYNMGKTGLANRMAAQYSENYFDLRLNNETARYIFRLLAIKTIMKNPTSYGFHLDESSLYPVYETKSVQVDSTITDLAFWAKEQGVNYKLVKKLNPWILGNSLPSVSSRKFEILLPKGSISLKPMNKYE